MMKVILLKRSIFKTKRSIFKSIFKKAVTSRYFFLKAYSFCHNLTSFNLFVYNNLSIKCKSSADDDDDILVRHSPPLTSWHLYVHRLPSANNNDYYYYKRLFENVCPGLSHYCQ